MLCLKGNKICCGLQVDFSLPMGSSAQWQYHHQQQPMQGQFTPVSGPSQPQGSPYFQPTGTAQPTPPMYIGFPPGNMPQYQTQIFEPRVRERKIIQVKDPNSNKDVTQEILNRQPSESLTGGTGGTPNNVTPDISGQSSSSSTPPLTLQQQAEANVRAQFAAQVAETLANSEGKPKRPDATTSRVRERKIIQVKDPNSNKDVTQEILNRQPSESLTGGTGGTPNNVTPDISGQSSSSSTPPLTLQQQAEANVRAQFAAQVAETLANSEGKPKRPDATTSRVRERKIIQVKDPNSNKDVTQEILNRQPSESLTGGTGGTPNNVTPDISGQSSSSSTPPLTLQQQAEANVRAQFAAQVAETLANLEDKPKRPDATTSAKYIIPNFRVEVFTADELRKKEAQQISLAAAGEVKPDRKEEPEVTAKPVSDVMPVTETKILIGPVALTNEETDRTEEVVTFDSQPVADAPPVQTNVAETTEPTESAGEVPVDQQVTETKVSFQHTEESEDLPSVLKVEDAVASEKVNGLDGNVNTTTAAPKNAVDAHATGWYHQRWCAT